jgi:3-oxoacid CoA-transferase A subunit
LIHHFPSPTYFFKVFRLEASSPLQLHLSSLPSQPIYENIKEKNNLKKQKRRNTSMPQIIDAQTAAKMVKEGHRLMCGGFLACGAAENLIDQLVSLGTKNIHLCVVCTDFPDRGVGKLIVNKQISSIQTSHIGTNKATQEQYNAGTLKIEFNPQGTFVERVRAAGAGLGGFLTPTGVGTILEKEKELIEVDGKKFFLERPMHGDIAFLRAKKADKHGNLVYSKSAENSNPLMAMAAKTVIVEVDEIVEPGEIPSDQIKTTGILVDYLVLHK